MLRTSGSKSIIHIDSEMFKSYEHARRHALSMIRKFGKFEDVEFRGSN